MTVTPNWQKHSKKCKKPKSKPRLVQQSKDARRALLNKLL